MTKVRVRFAPSPTGALHIGGLRTALFNYLFAKKNDGDFLLRIEDTDQKRFVEGAEEYIVESLKWIGIEADESPEKGGSYGPYRQSERKEMYQQYAQKLLDDGNAYYAFDTEDELEAMRVRLKEANVDHQQYNAITRMQMSNSLTLTEQEVQARLQNGDPYVIRLKIPVKEEIRLHDMVRDWVHVHATVLDDKVIMKSDGMPTYHLASVVDDHLMGITHIIRGEEWLSSAPLHVLLYRFLGWEESMPKFAHVPLLLKPDGNGKLSKRAADQMGFPIFPLNWTDPKTGELAKGFRESGYLPEAMVNFLVLLGWNPGTDEELFTLEELCTIFDVEKIGKAGAKFDIVKGQWFNQQYLKRKSGAELYQWLAPILASHNITIEEYKGIAICDLMKERISFPEDLWNNARYFFVDPDTYDPKVIKKKWTEEAVQGIGAFAEALGQLEQFNAEMIKSCLEETLEKLGIGLGKIMQALRVAVTGQGGGPDLMEIIEIIGKPNAITRMNVALERLADQVKIKQ